MGIRLESTCGSRNKSFLFWPGSCTEPEQETDADNLQNWIHESEMIYSKNSFMEPISIFCSQFKRSHRHHSGK